MRAASAIFGAVLALSAAAHSQTAPPAVGAVLGERFAFASGAGEGQLPIAVSQDWSRPRPGIARAVIVVHGYSRNAADYFAAVAKLAADERTLVIAPQFLAPEDIAAHHLPDSTLRWQRSQWSDGGDAEGPIPASSYELVDALLVALADRARLPDLSTVVLAGFSAGGQLAQRYAAVGRGADILASRGIALHYIVASPGSYLYFTEDRPLPEGGIGRFDTATCSSFNNWKYGLSGLLPRYVAPAVSEGAAALERRYVARDIIYLLGSADNDPNHPVLDTSCAAEAQGPHRYARGLSYFAYLQARDGALLKQRLWQAPGAGHQYARVLGSPCGRAALFSEAGCPEP